MARKTYSGDEISVNFDLKKCIHARNCFLKLPDVFDPSQRPWVRVENGSAEEIASVVRSCPSGALAFERKDSDANEKPPAINRITVMEDGPLVFAGALNIEGDAAQTRATLCRCGLSKNKPYCDGSHKEGNFHATGEPEPKPDARIDTRGGELTIDRLSNGSLKVIGNLEITTGNGRRVAQTERAFLCRCGQSKNKPFCDGSHKAAGFVDPIE